MRPGENTHCSTRMVRSGAGGSVACLRRLACTLVFSSAEITKSFSGKGSPPDAVIQIENTFRPAREIRIAGKDPTAVLPRAESIAVLPTPRRGAADLGGEAGGKTGRGARPEVAPRGRANALKQIVGAIYRPVAEKDASVRQ